MKIQKLKIYLINTAMVIVSLTLSLLASEFLIRQLMFSSAERERGALVHLDEFGNLYTRRELKNKEYKGCTWHESLVAHPYLGWVHRVRGPCIQPVVNNKGMPDKRDIPSVRDPEYFTILVVGGSVAQIYAQGTLSGKIWLEDSLNEKFVSPNGKPFRVLVGALGGWKFPAQNIAATLWGRSVDALVAIDGHNESLSEPMDLHDTIQTYELSRESIGTGSLIGFRTLRRWRNFCANNFLLKDSFAAVAVLRWMVYHVQARAMGEERALAFPNTSHPPTYSAEQRSEWSKEQFKHYVRLLDNGAKTMGLKFAHFLQPIPTYRKTLSEAEKRLRFYVTPEKYTPFLKASADLFKEGIASYSLDGVFENTKETIYRDEIHCDYDKDGDSLGNRMMNEIIVKTIAERWKLRYKSKL